MLKSLLLAITFALCSTTVVAEPSDLNPIRFIPDSGVTYDEETHTMYVEGYTNIIQETAMYRVIRNNDVLVVVMSGPGGDYYAGLRMGKLIQSEGLIVIIPENEACISACAFMALAGERVILNDNSSLMFHTPYVTHVPVGQTILEIVSGFAGAYNDMAEYLVSVNVPLDFGGYLIDFTSPCKFITIDKQSAINNLMTGDDVTTQRMFEYTIQDLCLTPLMR
jgi:hypothetical protein